MATMKIKHLLLIVLLMLPVSLAHAQAVGTDEAYRRLAAKAAAATQPVSDVEVERRRLLARIAELNAEVKSLSAAVAKLSEETLQLKRQLPATATTQKIKKNVGDLTVADFKGRTLAEITDSTGYGAVQTGVYGAEQIWRFAVPAGGGIGHTNVFMLTVRYGKIVGVTLNEEVDEPTVQIVR